MWTQASPSKNVCGDEGAIIGSGASAVKFPALQPAFSDRALVLIKKFGNSTARNVLTSQPHSMTLEAALLKRFLWDFHSFRPAEFISILRIDRARVTAYNPTEP